MAKGEREKGVIYSLRVSHEFDRIVDEHLKANGFKNISAYIRELIERAIASGHVDKFEINCRKSSISNDTHYDENDKNYSFRVDLDFDKKVQNFMDNNNIENRSSFIRTLIEQDICKGQEKVDNEVVDNNQKFHEIIDNLAQLYDYNVNDLKYGEWMAISSLAKSVSEFALEQSTQCDKTQRSI